MGFIWPRFQDTHAADRACGAAAGVSFFIMLVTAAVTWLQTSGKINILPGLDAWAYLDAGAFLLIGIGLKLHSRFAAICGIILFIMERAMMTVNYGVNPGQLSAAIIFGLIFLHGVRGAFAWHTLRKKELAGDHSAPAQTGKTSEPQPRVNYIRLGVLLFVLLAVGGGAFFYLQTNPRAVDFYGELRAKAITALRSLTPKAWRGAKAPPQGPAVQLKLKSGKSFDGIWVKENAEGIWLYIEDAGEVFFSRNEIEQRK